MISLQTIHGIYTTSNNIILLSSTNVIVSFLSEMWNCWSKQTWWWQKWHSPASGSAMRLVSQVLGKQWGRWLHRWLAQHGGPPGWLDEIDTAGVILYVMDGPYRLPFPYRIGCFERSCPAACWWNFQLLLYSKKMNTTIRHELRHARKAWPGTLVDQTSSLFGNLPVII